MASYTATSPCGWYLPITSPTTRAHFLALPVGSSRIWRMENSRRRCTGFSPSRTSGRARLVMVDRA